MASGCGAFMEGRVDCGLQAAPIPSASVLPQVAGGIFLKFLVWVFGTTTSVRMHGCRTEPAGISLAQIGNAVAI